MTQNNDNLTQKELEQRRQASRTHGVYAVQQRGEDAMTPAQRSRSVELQEQLTDREGVILAMRDAVVSSLAVAEIAQSYVIQQHKAGRQLDTIPLFTKLPLFWNSANRALKAYLDTFPADQGSAIDVTDLLRGDNED